MVVPGDAAAAADATRVQVSFKVRQAIEDTRLLR